MALTKQIQIGGLTLGGGAPLLLVAGPCVIESEDHLLQTGDAVKAVCDALRVPFVLKSSYDKANRSSGRSFRGPGLREGLRILARVKAKLGVPVLSDVHEVGQVSAAAEVLDVIQIPAFLCRQTDLIVACAATGRPVNIKKGQFIAPDDARLAVEKVTAAGSGGALLTERGSSFGYNDMVVDMRALVRMRRFAPVCFDATHSVQQPGAGGEASGGEREMVAPLARAAVAIGIDALFVETHPDPEAAPCDGPSQITPDALEALVAEARALERALRR